MRFFRRGQKSEYDPNVINMAWFVERAGWDIVPEDAIDYADAIEQLIRFMARKPMLKIYVDPNINRAGNFVKVLYEGEIIDMQMVSWAAQLCTNAQLMAAGLEPEPFTPTYMHGEDYNAWAERGNVKIEQSLQILNKGKKA